jgi:raffinose/stachyose/melibiose transport system permease protein
MATADGLTAAGVQPAPRQSPRNRWLYVLIAVPAFALFFIFALIPLLIALPLSFTEWTGIGPIKWAGLDNWFAILDDRIALNAIRVTLILTVASWLIQTPISLFLGIYLAGRGVYRAGLGAILFLPLLLSTTAVAITWSNLLDPNFGGINATLRSLGLTSLANLSWLGDRNLALVTVLFVVSWTYIPFHTLLYQAGAQQIPRALYEASSLDGAGRLDHLLHITLPLLRYTIVTSSTLIIVGSITSFDILFVMTGGGPGTSTRTLPLDMYFEGFQANHFGYASAIAVVIGVLGFVASYVLVRASGFARMGSRLEGQ